MSTPTKPSKLVYVVAALLPLGLSHAADLPPPLKTTVSVSAKEAYDSNVYLQDVTTQADKASMVTSLAASLGLDYTVSPLLKTSLVYTPEVNIFHSAQSETHVKHNVALTLSGKQENVSYTWASTLLGIDGSKKDLTFTGPGGAPAIGGVDIRDRRNAQVWRSSFKLNVEEGDLVLRPLVSYYKHDFHTYQRSTAGYENYVDREEMVAGLDVGYKATPKILSFVGVRFGKWDQENLLGVINNYSNTYVRGVVGVEGTPTTWLKVNLLIGQGSYHFRDGTVAGFPKHKSKFYSDSTITITPTKADTIVLLYRRLYQPGYTGRNIYEDITFDAQWKHVFDPAFFASVGFKEYDGFYELGNRHDRIHTASVSGTYNLDKTTSITFGYAHDWTTTTAPNLITTGRDFTRNQVYVGVRHTF